MEPTEIADGASAARLWLQRRVDHHVSSMAQEFLRRTLEELSLAVGDAATLRVLSADGRWLLGLAAYHPNPERQAAMLHAMRRTAEPSAGLWRPVIEHGETMEWNVLQARPAEASPVQLQFLDEHPVTRVLGMAVLDGGGRVIGGVSLVRFVTDRDFTEAERSLLRDVADRAARAIDFGDLARLAPD